MSGFLERLALRGQGGSWLASLPIIRPMPAIYGARALGSEPGSEMAQAEADGARAQPRAADVVPINHRQEPEPRMSGVTLATPPRAPAAPDRIEPSPASANASSQRSASPLPAVRIPAGERAIRRQERNLEGDTRADLPRDIARSPDRAPPSEPDHLTRKSREAVPSPSEPDVEASRPVPPGRTRSGLERLFEAIETADEAGVIGGATQARRDDVSAAPTAEEGPLVSIGRITISVAPPPASASSSPTGPPRSHGFSAYTRLRGGYER